MFTSNYQSEKCDICACYCDNGFNINSVNKFSLQEVRAKHDQGYVLKLFITKNILIVHCGLYIYIYFNLFCIFSYRVVTGIKFDIDGDTIVLKIRVGIFINGTVDASQQSWDSNYVSTFNPGSLPPYLSNSTDQKSYSHNNKHPYETVTLNYYWRNIYLDNLRAPPGKLIQGNIYKFNLI